TSRSMPSRTVWASKARPTPRSVTGAAATRGAVVCTKGVPRPGSGGAGPSARTGGAHPVAEVEPQPGGEILARSTVGEGHGGTLRGSGGEGQKLVTGNHRTLSPRAGHE